MLAEKQPRAKTSRLWGNRSLKNWIEKRITCSVYYDVDGEGKEKNLRWVGGLILDVSDGTWLMMGARTRCYAENEADYVLWDEV